MKVCNIVDEQLELFPFEVNQKVKLLKDIIEYPCGDSPGGVCGYKGDIVVIRRIAESRRENHGLQYEWPYSVSHEDRTDGATFAVGKDEIA